MYGKNNDGTCMKEGQTMPLDKVEEKPSGALTFNEIMLIVNGGVLPSV